MEGLGRAARNLRDWKAAEPPVAESLRLRQEMGDRMGAAESMALVGHLALWQGELGRAESWLRQYQATARGNQTGHYLARTLLLAGRFEEACTSAVESVALYLDAGQRREAVYSVALLAQSHLHLGSYPQASSKAGEALVLARDVDFPRGVGMSVGVLAAVELAEGACEEARAHSEESLAVWQQSVGHPSEFEGELACLALAASGLGHRDEAWAHLRAQLAWAQESWMLMPGLFGMVAVARLLIDEGNVERAVELYALASRYPFVAESRWFEAVSGRTMTAAAATLPAQEVTAARERGLGRELRATVELLLAELSR